MEINYQIFKEDLVSFHLKHFSETKIYKRSIINEIISVGSFIILVCIIFRKLYYFVIMIIGWLFFASFKKKRMSFLLRKKLNKIFSSEKYKDYFEPTKLVITEDGLQTITSLSEKVYKWKSIKIISLVDNYIFIITASNDEVLIPINSFKDSKDKELFLNNLVEKTNLEISCTYPINTKK